MKTDINTTDTVLGDGKGQDNQVESASALVSDVGQVTDTTGFSTPAVEFDPVANVFPMIEGKEFDDLVDDIKVNGLREPIWTHDGKILDGRNRYRACLKAGVQPVFRDWVGENPIAFVISANLRRRHMTTSQRAQIGAKLANMSVGRQGGNAQVCAVSQVDAAKLFNVSRRSVQNAKLIESESPALAEEVALGVKTIHAAKKELSKRRMPASDNNKRLASKIAAAHAPEGATRMDSGISSELFQKTVSNLSQRLLIASGEAEECEFLDVQFVIENARALLEKKVRKKQKLTRPAVV